MCYIDMYYAGEHTNDHSRGIFFFSGTRASLKTACGTAKAKLLTCAPTLSLAIGEMVRCVCVCVCVCVFVCLCVCLCVCE